MIAALVGYLAIAVATVFLIRQLFYRFYVEVWEDDAVNVVAAPFTDRPPIDKITQLHMIDRDYVLKYGPVIRFINPIKPNFICLLIADPTLMREIFVGSDWQIWQRPPPANDGHNAYTLGLISTPNGQKWRDTRALYEKTFTQVAVRRYTPILLDLRGVLMAQLEKANKENPEGFDIFPFYHRFTFDTITRLTFGEELKAQTTPEGAHYAARFDAWLEAGGLLATIDQVIGSWARILVPGIIKQQKTDNDLMFELIDRNIERIKNGEARVSIMDDVVNRDLPETIDREHLKKSLMSILFAGHDTTAALLSFLTYELSKRPDLQKAIREEVMEVAGQEDLSNLEVLEKCKVLNACIKESLRLRPSAPYGAARGAEVDFEATWTDANGELKKLKVQKGSLILPGIYAMHHYPAFWDKDPALFQPERFYEDPNGGASGFFNNLPFGNGGRRCVGERLALGEARLGIASLVRKFNIEHVHEGPNSWRFEEQFAGTIKPNKVMVKLQAV